jgi:hypothetical protein
MNCRHMIYYGNNIHQQYLSSTRVVPLKITSSFIRLAIDDNIMYHRHHSLLSSGGVFLPGCLLKNCREGHSYPCEIWNLQVEQVCQFNDEENANQLYSVTYAALSKQGKNYYFLKFIDPFHQFEAALQ